MDEISRNFPSQINVVNKLVRARDNSINGTAASLLRAADNARRKPRREFLFSATAAIPVPPYCLETPHFFV